MKAVEGTVLSGDHKGKSAWFCIDKNYVTSTKANSLTPLSPEETVTKTTMTTDKKLTDIKGDNWFKVENNRYVKESDGVEVSKYDLAKLGYRMIEDNNDSYSDDPKQIPKFFKALLKEIDTNQDGELSPAEIRQAYKTPEIREQLEKLIVKNESEWHQGGRVEALFESFLNLVKTEEQKNIINHEMTRIKELEFMSKVPNMGAEVWHMNPLSFANQLKSSERHWHDPVDNPMSTNYYQNGGTGSNQAYAWGLFGKKIRSAVGSRHDGLDLFAEIGTDVYACVDSEVFNIISSDIETGYGNILILKVDESEIM